MPREEDEDHNSREEDFSMVDLAEVVDNDETVGEHGVGTRNFSEEMVIDICKYNLRIMNTIFKHKGIQKYTWERTSLQLKS